MENNTQTELNARYFDVQKVKNEGGLGDIYFSVIDSVDDFPEHVMDFKDDIENFISAIQILYCDSTSKKLYDKYYESLFTIADLAFNSPTEKVKLAERSLSKLKNEITNDAGQSIRSQLLIDYLKTSVIPVIIMSTLVLFGDPVISWIFNLVGKSSGQFYISSLGLVSIAAMAGGWLSTATATRNLGYADILPVLNNHKGIIVRLIFINIFSLFISILMISGFLTINLGGLDSKNIVNDYTVALAFGFVLGFSEKVFIDKVESKLSKA
ncbi:hypothetical protein ACBI01_003286 [Aeromonas veronii]